MTELFDDEHTYDSVMKFVCLKMVNDRYKLIDKILLPIVKMEAKSLGIELTDEGYYNALILVSRQLEQDWRAYFDKIENTYLLPSTGDSKTKRKFRTTVNKLVDLVSSLTEIRPAILMMVNGESKHTLLSPPGFKHTLYDCQSRLLEKMIATESKPMVSFKGVTYTANAGRISERMSFGKTVTLCALASMKRDAPVTQFSKDSVIVGQPCDFSALKYVPVNVVVAEGKVIDQWEDYINNFTNLSSMTVGTKTQLEKFDKLLHSSPEKIPPVLLVKNSKLKTDYTPISGKVFEITFEGGRSTVGMLADILHNFCVSRVIFDDFDILQLPNDATLPWSRFTWYVSATQVGNFQTSFEKRRNERSVKYLSEDENLQHFNLKCTLDVVQSSFNNVKINAYKVNVNEFFAILTLYDRPDFKDHILLTNEELTANFFSKLKVEMFTPRACSKCKKSDYWNYMCAGTYYCVDCYNADGAPDYDFYVKVEGKKSNVVFSKEVYPAYLKNMAQRYMATILSVFKDIKEGSVNLPSNAVVKSDTSICQKFKGFVPGKRDAPLTPDVKPKVLIYKDGDKDIQFFADYFTTAGYKTTVYDDNFNVKDFETNDDFAVITKKTIAGLNMEFVTHVIGFSNDVDQNYEQLVGRAYRITRKHNLTLVNFAYVMRSLYNNDSDDE
jgi:hypothetical protein